MTNLHKIFYAIRIKIGCMLLLAVYNISEIKCIYIVNLLNDIRGGNEIKF